MANVCYPFKVIETWQAVDLLHSSVEHFCCVIICSIRADLQHVASLHRVWTCDSDSSLAATRRQDSAAMSQSNGSERKKRIVYGFDNDQSFELFIKRIVQYVHP